MKIRRIVRSLKPHNAATSLTVKVWDVETGRELHTLRGRNNVAVSEDGRIALSRSADDRLKVWDVETGRKVRILGGHTSPVVNVAMSRDGQRAVSAFKNKRLKVWDVETGALVLTFTLDAKATCCAFIGDAQLVAADEDGYLHFLRLEKPEC